jgi:methylmalonyl-CoA epimerase
MNLPSIESNKLDHIARVVPSIEQYLVELHPLLGWKCSEPEIIIDQGVKVVLLTPPQSSSTKIELLEPLTKDSAVGRFLETRGGAVHHIAFAVQDLEGRLTDLEVAGIRLIDRSPRIGAGGKRIAFIHPSVFGGLLVELCEEL